jgi:hypothetical protein
MKTNAQLMSKTEQIQKMVSLPAVSLAAEEADRFIDYVVDESILKNNARIVKMQKETKNIRALGVGTSRFLKPASTFASSDYLKTLAENKIALTTKKVRGCVAIFDDDLEDNIEGDAFAVHVMKMVAAKIANELDESFWISDTASFNGFGADDIRSLWDGWRYRIRNSQVAADSYYNTVSGAATLMTGKTETVWAVSTADVVGDIRRPITATGFVYICTTAGTTADAEPTWPTTLGESVTSGTSVWRCHAYTPVLAGGIAAQNSSAPYNWGFKYGKMLKVLPSKYKQAGLANLRFFNNDQLTQDYIDALAARSTVLGDQAILGKAGLSYGQVPIVSAPLMPTTMTAAGVYTGGNYADSLLTPKDNLIVGIQRDIKIESQRVAADEATYWFYSMRADVAIENVNACVFCEKITIA